MWPIMNIWEKSHLTIPGMTHCKLTDRRRNKKKRINIKQKTCNNIKVPHDMKNIIGGNTIQTIPHHK